MKTFFLALIACSAACSSASGAHPKTNDAVHAVDVVECTKAKDCGAYSFTSGAYATVGACVTDSDASAQTSANPDDACDNDAFDACLMAYENQSCADFQSGTALDACHAC